MAKGKGRYYVAWWEIRDDEDEETPRPYWYGYCEGDKDGDRLGHGQPLTMYPAHFPIGTRVDVEEPEDSAFYDRLWRGRDEEIARIRAGEADPRGARDAALARVAALEADLAAARAERDAMMGLCLYRITPSHPNGEWWAFGGADPARPGDCATEFTDTWTGFATREEAVAKVRKAAGLAGKEEAPATAGEG